MGLTCTKKVFLVYPKLIFKKHSYFTKRLFFFKYGNPRWSQSWTFELGVHMHEHMDPNGIMVGGNNIGKAAALANQFSLIHSYFVCHKFNLVF